MSSARVLVVEDNRDNMTLIVDLLDSMNIEVIQAHDGQEGLDKARSENPDIILMDLSLPIVDGWDATRLLKNDPDLGKIPIIALTAHALVGDRERALEAGCDDYLTKPLNLIQLMTKLTNYLEK